MFFLQRQGAPDLTSERVQGLRLSLNTPVVEMAELPVGPARAGILVHSEPDGRPNVTIGVRSLKNGEAAFFSYPGDLREETSAAVGASAALSFGEGMGFLFDDDEVSPGDDPSRDLALGLWNDLLAAGSPTGPPAEAEPIEGPDDDADEISRPLVGDDLITPPVDERDLFALDAGEPVASGDPEDTAEALVLDLGPDDEVLSFDELDGASSSGDLGPLLDSALPDDASGRFSEPLVPPAPEAAPEPLPGGSLGPAQPIPLDDLTPDPSAPLPGDTAASEAFELSAATEEADLPAPAAFSAPDASPLGASEPDGVPVFEPGEMPAGDPMAPAATEVKVEPDPAAGRPLSKFRQRLPDQGYDAPLRDPERSDDTVPPPSQPEGAAAKSADNGTSGGKQALGRLKLVKRRSPAGEEERRKWLVRLLSAF